MKIAKLQCKNPPLSASIGVENVYLLGLILLSIVLSTAPQKKDKDKHTKWDECLLNRSKTTPGGWLLIQKESERETRGISRLLIHGRPTLMGLKPSLAWATHTQVIQCDPSRAVTFVSKEAATLS